MNSASTFRPARGRSITSSVRKAGIVAAVAGGVSLFCAGVALAGDHWLSTSGQLLGLSGPNTDPDQGSARAASRRVAKSPINIVISLHSDPQEDHEQARYELIIESFADAIYEATNGAHQLGNVRIYTKFRYAQRADIVWGESGWPTAAPNGLGIRGQHIYMFDQFGDVNFLESSNNRAKGGYLLAHNWAHYAYGLYDEHARVASSDQLDDSAPHAVDIPVEPSIMNDPLNAADLTGEARYKWLNFSSVTEMPPGEFANTQATAQHRMHGVSGWETLIRKPGQDPRSGRLLSRPTRVYWPDLTRGAPDAAARWKQDLPDEAARSQLDIIWEESEVVYEIVLDRSGSMSYEDKLENAKTGLGWIIDRVEPGSSIGIVQYNHIAEVVVPITTIRSSADRIRIKDIVAEIQPGGSTAIGEAAQLGLDEITGYSAGTSNRVVFLLSDGRHNTGFHPFDVIPDYQAAEIPMFTFGYGSDADEDLLRKLAEATGGKYYYSPTGLGDITRVFGDAAQQVSQTVSVGSGTQTLAAGDSHTQDFVVDSSFANVGIAVSFPAGPAEAQVNLRAPGGEAVAADDIIVSGSSTQVRFNIDQPQNGSWQLELVSLADRSLDIDYIIEAAPAEGLTYALSLTNLTGQAVEYPDPIVLLAVMEDQRPITGAQVSGTVETPNGRITEVEFRDDGQGADAVAADGQYSATYMYETDGEHTATVRMDNAAGTARFTRVGLAPTEDEVSEDANEPISENFERLAVLQIIVSGVVDDDHGDVPTSATPLIADYADNPGRIESAGDVDVFSIIVPRETATLAVRVSDMSGDMNAILTILDQEGETELAAGTLAAGGYVVANVPAAPGSGLYAVVSHADRTGRGTYNISAGIAKAVDADDRDADGVPDVQDLCPDTLRGRPVDELGCSDSQQDLDRDGVPISRDACPDTRIEETANAEGCSVTQIDDDTDGVLDVSDHCRGTPAGQEVDRDGCSAWQLADDDADGIANHRDECPQTTPNEPVDTFGCGCSEFDDDSDGVLNCDDFCPGTPSDEQPDALGCSCAQLDEDGDDVNNCDDRCLGTLIGLPVDATGCPLITELPADLTAPPTVPSSLCGVIGLINLTLLFAGLSLSRFLNPHAGWRIRTRHRSGSDLLPRHYFSTP